MRGDMKRYWSLVEILAIIGIIMILAAAIIPDVAGIKGNDKYRMTAIIISENNKEVNVKTVIKSKYDVTLICDDGTSYNTSIENVVIKRIRIE